MGYCLCQAFSGHSMPLLNQHFLCNIYKLTLSSSSKRISVCSSLRQVYDQFIRKSLRTVVT
jgi:hypothetical protein